MERMTREVVWVRDLVGALRLGKPNGLAAVEQSGSQRKTVVPTPGANMAEEQIASTPRKMG